MAIKIAPPDTLVHLIYSNTIVTLLSSLSQGSQKTPRGVKGAKLRLDVAPLLLYTLQKLQLRSSEGQALHCLEHDTVWKSHSLSSREMATRTPSIVEPPLRCSCTRRLL